MAQVIDINQPEIRQSLNETIVWCTHRQLNADAIDNESLSRRFQMMDEASDLMREAYQESQRGLKLLRRDYSNSPKYKRAQELFSEAGKGSSVSFAQRLRTPELQASLGYTEARDDEARKRTVDSVIATRATLIATLEERQERPHAVPGRLLSYWPDENLSCGAAEVQSFGFFDVDNTPPWDLWVAFSDRMLLSWVPAELVEVAQRGIDVNPEGCIAWFKGQPVVGFWTRFPFAHAVHFCSKSGSLSRSIGCSQITNRQFKTVGISRFARDKETTTQSPNYPFTKFTKLPPAESS